MVSFMSEKAHFFSLSIEENTFQMTESDGKKFPHVKQVKSSSVPAMKILSNMKEKVSCLLFLGNGGRRVFFFVHLKTFTYFSSSSRHTVTGTVIVINNNLRGIWSTGNAVVIVH